MRDSGYIVDENPVYGQRCSSIRINGQMRDSGYIVDENPVYGKRCSSIRING